MEELRMMHVYQVFIMVLVQGATRSGFHHRTDLFFFTFATKAPVFQVSRIQAFFNLSSTPIRKISYDKLRT